jgi:hypothetical protein
MHYALRRAAERIRQLGSSIKAELRIKKAAVLACRSVLSVPSSLTSPPWRDEMAGGEGGAGGASWPPMLLFLHADGL